MPHPQGTSYVCTVLTGLRWSLFCSVMHVALQGEEAKYSPRSFLRRHCAGDTSKIICDRKRLSMNAGHDDLQASGRWGCISCVQQTRFSYRLIDRTWGSSCIADEAIMQQYFVGKAFDWHTSALNDAIASLPKATEFSATDVYDHAAAFPIEEAFDTCRHDL